MDFFTGSLFETYDVQTSEKQPFCRVMARGLRTHCKYYIHLKDTFSSINVHFKPAGKDVAVHPTASLAEKLCLSVRQVERYFLKEIGVGAKKYENLLRFDGMIKYSIKSSPKNWTDVAYANNYYDQMHMIKEFKAVLGVTPKKFCATNYAL